MNRRIIIICVIIIAGLILSETARAIQSAGESNLAPMGDLSWMWENREQRLQDPTGWFGSDASSWKGLKSSGPTVNFIASGTSFIPEGGGVFDQNSAFQSLKNYALNHKDAWGKLGETEFNLLRARRWKDSWQVILEQAVQGIPLYGTRLEGQFDRNGYLSMLDALLLPTNRIAANFALSSQAALRRLTAESSARLDFSRKVLYPVFDGQHVELRAAWQLRVMTNQRNLRPAGIVDAGTGEVLLRYNDVQYDDISGNITGLVLPAYWNDPPQSWEQIYQWVSVTDLDTVYSNSAGYYAVQGLSPGQYPMQGKLQGLFADVNNDAGPDASYNDTASTTSPLNYQWDYSQARQDEANTYYHTNLIHDYFKTLDSSYNALDYVMPVSVGQHFENAYWDGWGMTFGTGGSTFRNFALFSDVIYHEYTHGVTDGIYPEGMLPYTGQPGAMNEGWSDYFACTITNEPGIGEGGLQTNNLPLRIIDNNLVYPQNWAGEVHADGRIFAGALWDLRELLGAGISDTILHFSKYLLAETWENYFVDVLLTDDDDGNLSNGGPHSPQIYEAFGNHGIGPGLMPELSIEVTQILENGQGGSQGNGDGFYDPGEVLSMTFSVADSRYLYPPPAQDVTVAVWSENEDLSFAPQTFYLGSIEPGSSVQAPDSLLITIAPQAELNFTKLHFEINANGGIYQISDSLEIIVGHPNLVLVDDDGGANYQSFLNNSLRGWGQVFSLYNVVSQGGIPQSYLSQFEAAIWMTGSQTQNTLTPADQTVLSEYLDAGHNLILTGQNLVEDIGQTSFFTNYLKCSPLAGDVNDFMLDGVAGDPISDSAVVMILGGTGGNNQTSPAALAALPGGIEIFHYQHDTLHQPGAVRYESGTYKVVTYGFGLEAVSGLASTWTLGKLLNSNLIWFGLPTSVEDPLTPQSLPARFALGQAVPNPFNPSTTISYQLSTYSRVSLRVFDISGRLVGTVVEGWKTAGDHEVTFDGSGLASGIYLYTLTAGQDRASGKMVLLK
jgi:hypothetical protein